MHWLRFRHWLPWCELSDNALAGPDPIAHAHHHPVLKRHEVIDAAAEHDEADPLARLYLITVSQPADYAAGEVSGDLDHRVPRPGRVVERDQIALVMLAGVVAEGGAELAR